MQNPLSEFVTKRPGGWTVHIPREIGEKMKERDRGTLSAIVLIMWQRYEKGEAAQADPDNGALLLGVTPNELSELLDIKPSEAVERLESLRNSGCPGMQVWLEDKAGSRIPFPDQEAPTVNARGARGSN